jgi:large subunit ribosomal protein L28
MSKINTRQGRKNVKGNRITRRGLPKKSGGIGLNTTGISRRSFKTNMQRRKIRFSDGTVRRMWIKVKDLRAGVYDNPDKNNFLKSKV